MELGLKDKVALITGASRGIGTASAKALAYHGATVISLSRFSGYGFSAHAG